MRNLARRRARDRGLNSELRPSPTRGKEEDCGRHAFQTAVLSNSCKSFSDFATVSYGRHTPDMLLRICVSNHLSLRDPQELLLSASTLKDPEEGLIACKAAPKGSVLPAVVVYGANASGKSNLVAAVEDMRSMVLRSHANGQPGGGVPRQPFMLDPASPSQTTRFEADFVINDVRHHYGFEASDTAFESEWLYIFPKSRRRTLFVRDCNDFAFGRGLRGPNATISKLTRPNSLFVSAAAQNGHKQLSAVYRFFASIKGDRDVTTRDLAAQLRLAAEDPDPRVIEFLSRIDTGIVGYRRKKTAIPSEDRTITNSLIKAVSKIIAEPFDIGFDNEETVTTIELAHSSQGDKEVYLALDQESAGTRRLLELLRLAFKSLDEGVPLFLDGLDASLHSQVCEAVLRLFCSPETNPKGGQLVATTHTTSLMRSSVLRRDQVWFTHKDHDGATELYPLTDIRTRRGDNIESGYLQGRYGATPFEDPLSALG